MIKTNFPDKLKVVDWIRNNPEIQFTTLQEALERIGYETKVSLTDNVLKGIYKDLNLPVPGARRLNGRTAESVRLDSLEAAATELARSAGRIEGVVLELCGRLGYSDLAEKIAVNRPAGGVTVVDREGTRRE